MSVAQQNHLTLICSKYRIIFPKSVLHFLYRDNFYLLKNIAAFYFLLIFTVECMSINSATLCICVAMWYFKIESESPFEKSHSGQINSIKFNLYFCFSLPSVDYDI